MTKTRDPLRRPAALLNLAATHPTADVGLELRNLLHTIANRLDHGTAYSPRLTHALEDCLAALKREELVPLWWDIERETERATTTTEETS